MSVQATMQVRRMRGQTKSHLMMCGDGHLYVVKFQNNPQNIRVLANEFLATRLAEACGLTVPQCELVEVSDWLVRATPDLTADFTESRSSCKSHCHFGSRYVGGIGLGQLVDYMPETMLKRVLNLSEFAGMATFDAWCGNAAARQCVYWKKWKTARYRASFIDHGSCFDAALLGDASVSGLFRTNCVYAGVTSWRSFEPWISRIETFPPESVWEAALAVPSEWWGNYGDTMKDVVKTLIARRSAIKELITSARYSSRRPFPQWRERRTGRRYNNGSREYASLPKSETSTVIH